MTDNIGIIVAGFVGQALLKLLGDCPVHDPAKGLTDKDAINRCRFAFICVPSPTPGDGSCDTSIVSEVCGWIESDIIVIRSTVAPGTTDRLRRHTGKRIIFQPEYIGEMPQRECQLFEHHDHIMLMFRNDQDFQQACELLGIQKVQIEYPGGLRKIGIGRCVDGAKAIARLREGNL